MKRFLICFALGVGTLFSLTTGSQAQFYTPYAYNNNAYLNYAMAMQKAKATRNKRRVSKRPRRAPRAHSVKRTRRYSRAYSRR